MDFHTNNLTLFLVGACPGVRPSAEASGAPAGHEVRHQGLGGARRSPESPRRGRRSCRSRRNRRCPHHGNFYESPGLIFFVLLVCHSPVLDGFDGHFQASVHLTLSSAVNKSQRIKKMAEKFFRNFRNSNLGLLGENQECYLCAMQPPKVIILCSSC